MRRVCSITLAVAVAGGLVTAGGLVEQAFASGSQADSLIQSSATDAENGHALTIRFAAREVIHNVFLDVGAPGNSVGDSVIEHETLVQNGHEIGHDTLQCTAIHGAPNFDFQCVGTLVFADGQLTVQGATDFSEIRVAVTGGTGRYMGAYGELEVHGTATTTDRDVAHIVLPDR